MSFATVARRVSMLAAITLAPSAFAAGVSGDQLEMEKEGLQLIRQVEEVARDVRYNAGRLNSLANDMLTSRWTHYHHLEQIKSLVNEGLKPAMDRLTEIQPHLPEWKQQTINKLLESAKALAADGNDAILSKKTSGTMPTPMNTEYKELVGRIYEHSETLVKTSDAAGSYAAARLKAHEAGVKTAHK